MPSEYVDDIGVNFRREAELEMLIWKSSDINEMKNDVALGKNHEKKMKTKFESCGD